MIDLEKAGAWLDVHVRPGEDWDVLVDGDKVYLRASIEGEDIQRHEITLAELKSFLVAAYSSHINRVRVAIPIDAQQRGGTDFLVWLTDMDWGKFHTASRRLKNTTLELVTAFRLADSGSV
jgi:hypothetical protein